MTNNRDYFSEEESRELVLTNGPCPRDGGKVLIKKTAGYVGQPKGVIDLHCETCGARGELPG